MLHFITFLEPTVVETDGRGFLVAMDLMTSKGETVEWFSFLPMFLPREE